MKYNLKIIIRENRPFGSSDMLETVIDSEKNIETQLKDIEKKLNL